MMMRPSLRKLVLTAHVGSSVGLLGAVAGFLALTVAGLGGGNAQTVRAACPAMDLLASFVILPLALASLLTGTVQSLGTRWGLFRHWWVVIKLLLTVSAIVVLLLQMPLIAYMADMAAGTTWPAVDFRDLRGSLVVHAGGGLLVLLVATTLSVYKPRGMTRHGLRTRPNGR